MLQKLVIPFINMSNQGRHSKFDLAHDIGKGCIVCHEYVHSGIEYLVEDEHETAKVKSVCIITKARITRELGKYCLYLLRKV